MLTIGSKVGVGVTVLLLLCVLIGMVSYVETRHVRQKVEEITEIKEPLNSAVYGLDNNLMETAFSSLGYLSTGDATLLADFSRSSSQFAAIRQRYLEAASADSSNRINERLGGGFTRLHAVAAEQIRLYDAQKESILVLLTDLDSIDALMRSRIHASMTADDPLAYRRLKVALEMEVNLNSITKGLGNFLLTGQPHFEPRIRRAEREFKRYFQYYQNVLLSSDERKWAAQLQGISDHSIAVGKVIIALEQQRRAALEQFFAINRELESVVNDGILLHTEAGLAEAKRDVARAGATANAMILIVLLVSVLFGVGAGVLTTKSITRPLGQLSAAMHAIAHGDRSHRVAIHSGEDLRAMGEAFNFMTGQLFQTNEELRGEILERQRAEEALRVTELRFRTIFEHAPIGIALASAEGKFVSVNPAFLESYGFEESDVVGNTMDTLRLRTAAGDLPNETLTAIRGGGWSGELISTRKCGEDFPVLLSTNVVRDDRGVPIALVVIAHDTTAQKRLQEQLDEARRQRSAALREFAVSVQRAQEEERRRISRELHDDLCQRLSGMKLTVEVLGDDVRPLSARTSRKLREVTQELDRSISEVRRISSNLRPSVLDDFGLVIALKLLCREFETSHGVRVALLVGTVTPRRLEENFEIAVYRIVQEALTNIVKHARATTVTVRLSVQNDVITLIVSDDGKGFDDGDTTRAKDAGHGSGLMNMRERSELLGGQFTYDTARDRGTTITVAIPLRDKDYHEENQDTDRG